jgi:hypothetical protein
MKSLWIVACVFLFGLIAGGKAWAGECSDAIRQVEVQYGMPYQLLDAISVTESGRYLDGKIEGWPWTLSVDGHSYYFETKKLAVSAFKKFISKNENTVVAVGCMQLNWKHHSKAFSSLEEGFDPKANVRYSAQFLQELKARHDTWAQAIAHYHSATPERQMIYKKRILTAWRKQRGEPDFSTNINLDASQAKEIPDYHKENKWRLETDMRYFWMAMALISVFLMAMLAKKIFIFFKSLTIGQNTLATTLYSYRPKEVYFLSTVLFCMIFLNLEEAHSQYFMENLLEGNFVRAFDYIGGYSDSAVFGIIRGIGDDNLRRGAAENLYWVCAAIFIFLTINKAKRISKWLWNE